MTVKREDFEVIIIGSGIGGLATGALLAKQGIKPLVLEKHSKAGGCCTSFERKGFRFNAGVHYLGSLRADSPLNRLVEDLGLNDKLVFSQAKPFDRFILPDCVIDIFPDPQEMSEHLCQLFPDEVLKIRELINLMDNGSMFDFFKFSKYSWSEFLDLYFQDKRLKAAFGLIALHVGMSPAECPAIAILIVFRDYLFYGGHSTVGGVQKFADALADTVVDHGGQVNLNEAVTEIIIKGGRAIGVRTQKAEYFARHVVSNADAKHTFTDLIADDSIAAYRKTIQSLEESVSHFMVYLGLKGDFKEHGSGSIWVAPPYDKFEQVLHDMKQGDFRKEGYAHIFCPSYHDPTMAPEGCSSVLLSTIAPYGGKEYWQDNKERMKEALISRVEPYLRSIGSDIVVEEAASPWTIYRYTNNYGGANFGWKSSSSQFGKNRLSQRTPVENLSLVGHWTQPGSGIGPVIRSAYLQVSNLQRKLNT